MGEKKEKKSVKLIPHSRPTLGQHEIEQVAGVIESAQIGQGDMAHRFEQAFAAEMGVEYAASVSSGTAALHLTLLAMGIGPEDEVIIPSFVCTALLHAVRYVGAVPVMAEIDPATYNLNPDDVKRRLTGRTRAIIVPHLFGLPANLDGLLALNVPIIEDCAQAVGSVYNDQRVGTFGQAAVFSFYATKVMTTGEGGMVVSNSRDIIDRVKDLRECDKKDDDTIRYNYKTTDIHAAIGLAQLTQLETFIRRRRIIAQSYDQAFEAFDLRLPPQKTGHIYFRYVIGLRADSKPWIRVLREKGIECARPVYLPLHRYLKLEGYAKTDMAWNRSISIPIYPSLTQPDINRVIDTFTSTYREA